MTTGLKAPRGFNLLGAFSHYHPPSNIHLPMSNLRLRILSYVIMAYMLMAFGWWAMLLFTKNKDAFAAKSELLVSRMVREGSAYDERAAKLTEEYMALAKKYKRQEYMIFGEALMFVFTLLGGLWFINQGYQREERANQQRRNFLLSITHELKSPIASIRLVLETLIKRELPKEKANQLATSALREDERLHELVENLLLSAKLDTAYQPHFEELDLVKTLEDLIAKFAVRYPSAEIILKSTGDHNFVRMDRQGLISIATNLIENAIKYAESGPQVEVRIRQHAGKLEIEFADNGPGIPEKEKKRIFEKFYRVGNEETRRTKGTGLGLFIVQQIVKAHQGSIQVLDNQPRGTVFRLTING